MMNIPGQNTAQTSLAAEVMDEFLTLADQTDEMLTPEELRQISGGILIGLLLPAVQSAR
uniref:Uncharacterized protein n=1 Tax=Cyanothece sp. (strain PCC 7425 / ATCC 29141) TaxID=395961 RepID=B8HZ66_CYAP4